LPSLLAIEPEYRERVWGGQRLRAATPPIGEAWIAYGGSHVRGGPLAGRTLDELTRSHGPELLGAAARRDDRFPLLAKLLDCADWLSVQVHPNDEEARRMVGPGEWGKTEAWYFLEADPGARILVGVKPGVGRAKLAAAIREGRVVDVAAEVEVRSGEAILIPAGTLHALGPGLLLYEIQQASDTTYRAYDWGRQGAGRKLHVEESAAVARAVAARDRNSPRVDGGTGATDAVACDYFDLDLVRVAETPLAADTGGRSFHIVTAIDGKADVICGGDTVSLSRFETALVTAAAGEYEVRASGSPTTLLRAALP
jgi:mannose-6-phosphate isomerase